MIKRLSPVPQLLCTRIRAIAWAAVCAGALLGATASAATAAPAGRTSKPIGAFTNQGTYRFLSAPSVRPPQLAFTVVPKHFKRLAHGYLLLANFRDFGSPEPMVGQGGPMIFDRFLQPVWYLPRGVHVYVNNLVENTYNHKPVLSWWQGTLTKLGAPVTGSDVIVDQHYKRIATLTGTGGWIVDFHELQISGKYAYVTGYRTLHGIDLTPYSGAANGSLLDSGVLQFDLSRPGTPLVKAWSVYQDYGIPLSQTFGKAPANPAAAWDAYHINSIQVLGPAELLISLRNTWGVYDVKAGVVQWTLGGRGSQFAFAKHAAFEWQHDAQLHGHVLTVFDDACCEFIVNPKPGLGKASGPSRGLALNVDFAHHTVTLRRQYVRLGNPQHFDTATQGNTQLLPNGDAVVGWGGQPYVSEYNRAGKLLFDFAFPSPNDTYRAYVSPWVGLPPASAIGHAIRRHGATVLVYVSWNGATQVARWRLWAGNSAKHLKVVAVAAKVSFETTLQTKRFKVYKLQAVDARGKILGASKAF
jgi:Arylsulfotransferase (ASST)